MKKEIRFALQFIGISILSLIIACSLSPAKIQHKEIKKIDLEKRN